MEIGGERRAGEIFEARAIGCRQVGGEPGADDRRVGRALLVEAERLGAARQRRHGVEPGDDSPDQRDVAVEVARGVADHCIKFAAGAGIGRQVAADADHRVTMGEVDGAAFAIERHRPAGSEPGGGGIGIGRAERADRETVRGSRIFGRRFGDDTLGQRRFAFVIAPLDDIIVLDAVDFGPVPPAAAGQCADVGDVDWRERGRELHHHFAATGQLEHQQILGRDGAPVGLGRGGDDVARRLGLGNGGCGQREREQGKGGESAHSNTFRNIGALCPLRHSRESGNPAI